MNWFIMTTLKRHDRDRKMKKSLNITFPFAEAVGYIADVNDKSFANYGDFDKTGIKKLACLRYITVNRRGNGDGNRMLEAFIAKCREAGADAIILCCDASEKQVKGFVLSEWYYKYGFDQVGKTPVMIKKL